MAHSFSDRSKERPRWTRAFEKRSATRPTTIWVFHAEDRQGAPAPSGADFVDRIFAPSDRNNRVLTSLSRMFSTGRLAGTGYLSILPVDQGIEHSAGASFAKNPTTSMPKTS
jgi:hypothetical protein